MSTLAFLSESPTSVFTTLADHSVNLVTDSTDHDNDDSQERRLERVKYCMSMRQVFDPHSGLPRQVPTPCRVWRLCPVCARQRRKDNQARIERAVSLGPVRKVEFGAGDSSKNIVRKYGKELIVRYPTLDDDGGECETVFIATDDPIGKVIDSDTVRLLPWRRLVMTPEGKKISGGLGKVSKPDSDLDTVKQTSFVVDGLDEAQQVQAQQSALRQTIDLNPQSIDELQKALSKRESAYARSVRKLGGTVVFSQVMRVSVDISRIRWKMTLPQSIRLVREANLKLPSVQKPKYKDLPPEYRRIVDREEWLSG